MMMSDWPLHRIFTFWQISACDAATQSPANIDEYLVGRVGLQEAGVDSLGFVFYEVKHGFHHPRGREHFAVIDNALF
jgi:hypothetical protein